MYQSTENENIDITLDLRSFGVPWALHCWIRTLVTAHNNGFGSVIDELLQDFCKDWTEDNSSYFTDECLPVLFSIFRQTSSQSRPRTLSFPLLGESVPIIILLVFKILQPCLARPSAENV